MWFDLSPNLLPTLLIAWIIASLSSPRGIRLGSTAANLVPEGSSKDTDGIKDFVCRNLAAILRKIRVLCNRSTNRKEIHVKLTVVWIS